MKSRQKKVLVAVPTNGTDGRLRIAGILKYARARASWDIHFVCSRTSFTDEEVRDVLKSGLDGCILAAYTPAVKNILARRIPTVIALENMHEQIGRRANCVSVLMDNREIGRIAAEHFKSLGRFASYAFIPAPPKIPWSMERKSAFFENAPKNAQLIEYPESEFDMDNMTGEAGIQMHVDELIGFLQRLPRPAAVFAANDILAVQVARACHEAHIRIPSELALVGCDNGNLRDRPRERPIFQGVCVSPRRQRSWHNCQQLGDLLRVAGGAGSDATAEAVDGRAKAMQLGAKRITLDCHTRLAHGSKGSIGEVTHSRLHSEKNFFSETITLARRR